MYFLCFLCTFTYLLERGLLVPDWLVILSFSIFSSTFVAERSPISLGEITPSIQSHLVIFCLATFCLYRATEIKERWMWDRVTSSTLPGFMDTGFAANNTGTQISFLFFKEKYKWPK